MNQKYHQYFRKISLVLFRLINETLKLFPFGMVIIPVILFYFSPDDFIGEIICEWQKSDVSGKIFLIRMYLKATFVCAFVAVFLRYFMSDDFMSGRRVNK